MKKITRILIFSIVAAVVYFLIFFVSYHLEGNARKYFPAPSEADLRAIQDTKELAHANQDRQNAELRRRTWLPMRAWNFFNGSLILFTVILSTYFALRSFIRRGAYGCVPLMVAILFGLVLGFSLLIPRGLAEFIYDGQRTSYISHE